MDKHFTMTRDSLFENERTNPKAIRNREETIKMIDRHGGLFGNVLDIGERNLFTEILENRYGISPIFNTYGDLDTGLRVKDRAYGTRTYDWVNYNNVIEHQFNPLFTLLQIKKRLKRDGIIILGTPVKPNWITSAKCHFHEFDQYRFERLIARAGLKIIDDTYFWYEIRLWGIRGVIGSFYPRQYLCLLKEVDKI